MYTLINWYEYIDRTFWEGYLKNAERKSTWTSANSVSVFPLRFMIIQFDISNMVIIFAELCIKWRYLQHNYILVALTFKYSDVKIYQTISSVTKVYRIPLYRELKFISSIFSSYSVVSVRYLHIQMSIL